MFESSDFGAKDDKNSTVGLPVDVQLPTTTAPGHFGILEKECSVISPNFAAAPAAPEQRREKEKRSII